MNFLKTLRLLLILFACLMAILSLEQASAIEVKGQLNIVVVPVAFQDNPPEFKVSLIGFTASNYFESYFEEVSYGKISVNIRLINWTTLSYSWSSFESYAYNNSARQKLLEEVIKRMPEDALKDCNVLLIVHTGSCNPEDCVIGGVDEYGGIGSIRYAVLPLASGKPHYIYAVLRALGLSEQKKANGWTIMSKDSWSSTVHLLSVEKLKLGWMSYGSNVMSVKRGERIEISLPKMSSQAAKALILPVSETKSIFIEYRFADGEDVGIPQNGVLVYLYDHSSDIVEILATLWVDEEFISESLGFIVRVVNVDPLEASLIVTNGLPDLSIEKVRVTGETLPDEKISLIVKVSNVGTAESCPFEIRLKKIGEDEVLTSLRYTNALKPGESANFTFQITVDRNMREMKVEVLTQIDRDPNNNVEHIILEIPTCLIVSDFRTGKPRYDINSEAEVVLKVVRNTDRKPADGAVLEFGGVKYVVNSTGFVSIRLKSDKPGRVEVLPKLSSYHGISCLEFEVTPYAVFDTIEVYRADISDSRVNVGENVKVKLYVRYAYDRTPFEGIIVLNNNQSVEGKGMFTFNISKSSVGDEVIKVASVSDNLYGLKTVSQKPIKIIWDEVVIKLSTDKLYYNVGERADIKWNAYYAYDKKPFKGVIELSSQSPVLNSPGQVKVEVVSIKDELYDITKFVAKPLLIHWDRVSITLRSGFERYALGSNIPIQINAFYESDGRPFNGSVILKPKQPRCSSIGRLKISVNSVSPDKRGITSYDANELSIVCDLIDYFVNFDAATFGYAKLSISLRYRSDGNPVDGKVSVNGKQILGKNGLYLVDEPFYGLIYKASVRIDVPGFETRELEVSKFHVVNALTYSGAIAITGYTVIKLVERLRRKKPKAEEGYSEETEELEIMPEVGI